MEPVRSNEKYKTSEKNIITTYKWNQKHTLFYQYNLRIYLGDALVNIVPLLLYPFAANKIIKSYIYRCLHKTGGHLPYKPPKSIKIVTASFKLHNKSIDEQIPLLENNDVEVEIDHDGQPADNNDRDGQAIRNRLIQRF